MTSNSKRQAVKAALSWELRWLAVELICVGTGLWLSLKLQWMTVGNLWLLAFLAGDFVVRYQHYLKIGPSIHGPQVEH